MHYTSRWARTSIMAVTILSAFALFFVFTSTTFASERPQRPERPDRPERPVEVDELHAKIYERICMRLERIKVKFPWYNLPPFCTEPEPEPEEATLTLIKTVINDDGGTASTTDFQAKIDGSDVAWETAVMLTPGSYTASEVTLPGYTSGDWGGDCAADGSITLADGDDKVCTITNDDNALEPETATLTLIKVVINDDEGTSTTSDWTLMADGPTTISGVTGSAAVTDADVPIGTYDLSESGPSGYTASAFSCVVNGGDAVDVDAITLGVDDVATCTITNDDDATPPVETLDHIIISEVYYDVDTAHGEDSANEWIELHNPTDSAIDISGWSITDAMSSDVIPATTTIPAGGFVVLVATTSTEGFWTIPEEAIVVDMGGTLGNGLGNSGDSLTLMNTLAESVDALSWGSNTDVFDPSAPASGDGDSTARILLTVDTDTAADWEDREDPTPGS